MKSKKNDPPSGITLRQKAEELLKQRPSAEHPFRTESEMLKLIHELEVNQIELEMQQDELIQANNQLVIAQQIGHIGSWSYDLAAQKLSGTIEAKRLFGLGSDEASFSLQCIEACIPERERVHQALLDLINKNIPYDLEYVIHPADGSAQRVVISKATPEHDAAGNLISIIGVIQDITERKQSEELLRQSSQKWETIVSTSPDGIGMVSLDGKIQFLSDKLAGIYGYSSEEKDTYIGRSIFDFIDPSNHKMLIDNIHNLLAGKRYNDLTQYQAIKKDNSRFHVELYSAVLQDSSGKPESILYVERDITQRKMEEDKLRASEEKFRHIFETVQDAYYEASVDGIVLELSPSINIISQGQYTRNELIGKSLVGFYANPDDRNSFFSKLFKRGSVSDYELAFKNKNGAIVPISISSVLMYDASGNPEKITGTMRDITERKKAEEKIQSLNTSLALTIDERTVQLAETYENLQKENAARIQASAALEEALDRLQKIANRIPGVVYQFRLNPDGTSCFPFASEGIHDIYRVSPQEIANDASRVFARLHPDDFDGVVASIRASAKDLMLWRHEYRVKFEDGDVRWVLGNAMPQLEANGSVLWHGFISDITERKQAEDDLKQLATRFALAVRAGGVGVWDYDIVNNILVWDDQMFALYGIKKRISAALTMHGRQVFTLTIKNRVIQKYRQRYAEKKNSIPNSGWFGLMELYATSGRCRSFSAMNPERLFP